MHISKPEHTDKIGLFNLIATANKHKCRILCLTARSPELKEITIKHMKYLDVPIDEIYFCEKIGKGHYLNSIIDDGDDIIFVDDLDKNLLNVLDNVKFAKSLSCFKFIIS